MVGRRRPVGIGLTVNAVRNHEGSEQLANTTLLRRSFSPRVHNREHALMVIRVRAALVAVRTSLVNTVRGLAKSMGERLPQCDADQMGVARGMGAAVIGRRPRVWNLTCSQ